MLGSLAGVVTARLDQRILIEVNGVGYWVYTGSWQPEGEVIAYLYQQVREDAQLLFGFVDLPTLQLFEQLIGINGIGPKAALALLSLGSQQRLREAIVGGDVSYLSSASGVGPKAAQKVILEMRGKLPDELVSAGQSDLLAALENLGYKAVDVRPYLNELPAEVVSIDAQLRWILQQIGR